MMHFSDESKESNAHIATATEELSTTMNSIKDLVQEISDKTSSSATTITNIRTNLQDYLK